MLYMAKQRKPEMYKKLQELAVSKFLSDHRFFAGGMEQKQSEPEVESRDTHEQM
jgi:hypothetical protein